MQPENVIDYTRVLFPDFREQECLVTPLEKGGSGRFYYRVQMGNASMIFVKYTDQREENRHFVEIDQFLHHCGIRVPQIYHHDSKEGLIWMQDLGVDDLFSFRTTDWKIRRLFYQSAIEQVARLHGQGHHLQSSHSLKLQPAFDEKLYLWEQGYFFQHAVRGYFGCSEADATALAALPALRFLAQRLASLPRCFIHRDFQSENILIHDATAWLIDFQGMRFGLPHYDLASLLYDPYVHLSAVERSELLDFYQEVAGSEGVLFEGDFMEVFLACAAQRLMQALGAYGFLGLQCSRPAFLRHIPTATRSLSEVLSRIDGLAPIVNLLNSACEPKN